MLVKHLLEARDSKRSYKLVEVKGKVDKVIVTLTGKESEGYTKLAKRYREIDSSLKALTEERNAMNEMIKNDMLENFFDAEDEVYTRIVETVSLTAQLTKVSAPSPKVDNDKVVEGLLKLMPELQDKISELQSLFTEIPKARSAALSIKTNESFVDLWTAFKEKTAKLLKSFISWGRSFDSKLAKLKHQLEAAS